MNIVAVYGGVRDSGDERLEKKQWSLG
jgi:hypothetical protein